MRHSAYGFEVLDNCRTCQWRNDRCFCAVSQAALEELDRYAFGNVYPAGAIIFCEGEAPRGVFILCRGAAKLTVGSGDGKVLIARVAHSGDALGLSSVLAGHPYKESAETLGPSQVKFIRRDEFMRWLDEHPDVCRRTCGQLIEECETSNEHVRTLGLSHSAAEKLAQLIVHWCEENGHVTPAGMRVQMLLTHNDISQHIGTSRETVTRLLKDFRSKGYLSVKGSTLIVADLAALRSMVRQ